MDGAGAGTGPGGRAAGAEVPTPPPAQRVPRPEPGPRGRPDSAPAAQRPPSPPPPPPGPAAGQPRAREAPDAEPVPWAPVELRVDVRVKPVGPAGGGRAPSPAPSTRFLAVPVPESPARTASTGGTWGPEAEGAPRCRCRCRDPGPGEAAPLRPGRAGGDQKLPRAIRRTGLPMYMKSLRWALAIMAVLLAVSTVAIVALASTAGARCRPCPQGWLWSGEHCYYLSADAQSWEASQAFCSAQHATLPLLIHTQDFLTRYPVTKYSWVGARRGPQGWHWIDGAPLPAQLLPEETEDQPHLECGGLEGGKLVALDCASSRPWACAKGTM